MVQCFLIAAEAPNLTHSAVVLPSSQDLDRACHEADGEAMSASVAAWRASAVRKGVMGLKSDDDWFSPSWSVHVTDFSPISHLPLDVPRIMAVDFIYSSRSRVC